MKNFNNQSGRSMIEMLGVLAIVGVLSVGGIAGYSKAMAKFKMSKTTDQVSMMVANARTTYGNSNNFSGLDNQNACKLGIIPSEMLKDKACVASAIDTNAYSGEMLIESVDGDAAFGVLLNAIPKDACISIASSDWGGDTSAGFLGLEIAASADLTSGGIHGSGLPTWSTDKSSPVPANDLPLTPIEAEAACDATNNITWYFN